MIGSPSDFLDIKDSRCTVGSVNLYYSDCTTSFSNSFVYVDSSNNIKSLIDRPSGYVFDICVKITDISGVNVVTQSSWVISLTSQCSSITFGGPLGSTPSTGVIDGSTSAFSIRPHA